MKHILMGFSLLIFFITAINAMETGKNNENTKIVIPKASDPGCPGPGCPDPTGYPKSYFDAAAAQKNYSAHQTVKSASYTD